MVENADHAFEHKWYDERLWNCNGEGIVRIQIGVLCDYYFLLETSEETGMVVVGREGRESVLSLENDSETELWEIESE